MIEVSGESNTYFLECANSNLYLTANADKPISQETPTKADNQKWIFENANATTEMAPPTSCKYRIKCMAGNKLYMDVQGGGININRKGAKMQLYNLDGEPDRTIQLHANATGKQFLMQPLHSTEVMEITGGENHDGNPVQLWEQNNSAAQFFEFEYAGSPRVYRIKSVHTSKYIEADKSQTSANNCKIYQSEKNIEALNQKWKLESVGSMWAMPPQDQVFIIRYVNSDNVVDISGGENKDGAKLQLWDKNNSIAQQFKFIPSGDNSWLFIQAQNGGRNLDIPGGQQNNGAHIQIWQANNGNAQKFAIKPTSANSFVLLSTGRKAITVQQDKINEKGTNIILWDQQYHPSQQFVLIYNGGSKNGQEFHFDGF